MFWCKTRGTLQRLILCLSDPASETLRKVIRRQVSGGQCFPVARYEMSLSVQSSAVDRGDWAIRPLYHTGMLWNTCWATGLFPTQLLIITLRKVALILRTLSQSFRHAKFIIHLIISIFLDRLIWISEKLWDSVNFALILKDIHWLKFRGVGSLFLRAFKCENFRSRHCKIDKIKS